MTTKKKNKVAYETWVEAWNKTTDKNLGLFIAKEEPYVGKRVKIYDVAYVITMIIPLVLPDSPAELFCEVEPVS